MDKSWMRKPRSSREYIRGVMAFVKFASQHSRKKGYIVCPCKRCSLGKTLSNEAVFDHLTSGAGIIEGYTEWIMHGEPLVAPVNSDAISKAPSTVRVNSIPLHGGSSEMQEMLNDVFVRNDVCVEAGGSRVGVEAEALDDGIEDSNKGANKLEDLLKNDIAKKAKTNRGLNKHLHTLGSKSMAQVASEMAEHMGETPNRDEMWVVTHTKKDGNPVTKQVGETITQIKTIIERREPAKRVCSQGSIYWSPNDTCGQVLGREHSGHVCRVGSGLTPSKSTSYTSEQGSISSAPTLRERALVVEVESLKNLYASQIEVIKEQNVKLQEQNALYHQAQQEELGNVKRMVEMLMKGKQPSMRNNQEG